MHPRDLSVIVLLLLTTAGLISPSPSSAGDPAGKVTLDQHDGKVTVLVDGELFTEYVYEGYEKPILYPVIGPHEISMTRNWPMRETDSDEAQDHPHHKSIWFGHMKVNGESFWHVGDTAGTTEQTQMTTVNSDTIRAENKLVDRSGRKIVGTDSREIRFWSDGTTRFIEYTVTYHATHGDITFGDNKDGQMGIRMNARLRLKGDVAVGKAINSAGDTSNNIWGKRAKWIDFWGKVDGHTVGIAVFDHPSNLRHPTWWHARDYGLLSANPFGIHHFEDKEEQVGEYRLSQGDSLRFCHLFVFHEGDHEQADISSIYDRWIAGE